MSSSILNLENFSLKAFGASLGLSRILPAVITLALCLLALVVLALCFLMASYPEECRQFWRMLRETRAEGRGNDS